MSVAAKVGLIAGGLFAAFVLFRVVQLVIFLRDPNHSRGKPGEAELHDATRKIISARLGTVHGNTAAAKILATNLSAELKNFEAAALTGADKNSSLLTDGQFLVFCQLSEEGCAFLIHVPQMKRYTHEAAEAMAKFAYVDACKILDKADQPNVHKLAIAIRGDLLYDSVLIGDYKPGDKDAFARAKKIATDGLRAPALVPFFVPASEPVLGLK